MQIRIKSTPPGEAPEHVRQAWIGLVLPIPARYATSRKAPMAGVLSGPQTIISTILALFRGQISFVPGYVVAADTAIEILSRHSPDAASWWRQNAARAIAPGKHFVFAKDVCEEIQDDEAS